LIAADGFNIRNADDPKLLFGQILFARCPAKVFDGFLAVALSYSGHLSHRLFLVVSMSQKTSLIKSPKTAP